MATSIGRQVDENNVVYLYFNDGAVQEQFMYAIENLKVLARASPEDKMIIAMGLKGMNKKIAVIGDGMNDVDSFQIADVSFAMGSSCSYARHHASMVLVEDNF